MTIYIIFFRLVPFFWLTFWLWSEEELFSS